MLVSELAAKGETKEEIIVSVLDYLGVLMENYPSGVTQGQLAKLSSVTPSAVSKTRDKLLSLCDVNTFAFKSRLVLNPDLSVLEIALRELLKRRNYLSAIWFLSSPYGERVITQSDIHERISNKIPLYRFLFSKEESELAVRIILRYIRSFRQPRPDVKKTEEALKTFQSLGFLGPNGESYLFSVLLGSELREKEFDWPIETESELLTFIGLRDKIFHILKFLIIQFTEGLSIMRRLETEKEKHRYREVYDETIDFYLRKVFALVTDSLKSSAGKSGLPFPDEYRKIGENVHEEFLEILKNQKQKPNDDKPASRRR